MSTKPSQKPISPYISTGGYILLIGVLIGLTLHFRSIPSEAQVYDIDIPAQTDWIDYGPIFGAGAVGEWDHLLWGGFANSSIKIGDKYFIYYQGSEYYRTEYDEGVMWRSIGVAVSDDGVNFVKYSGNPVLTWFPNQNGEEGAVSSGVTIGDNDEIVLFYGANTEETATTVNADARVAISLDGYTFEDRGIVLNHSNPQVWGYGDEIFPIDAIYEAGRWIVYYIPNGVSQSGKLGVAYGDRFDRLTRSAEVKSGPASIPVWGSASHVRVGEGSYAITLNNIRENRTEVRILSIDEPTLLGAPVMTYQLDQNQVATLLLDEERNTWFMYYQDEDEYGVKLAPAGEPDSSPPSAPTKLRVVNVDAGIIDLSWQPAEDADTGVIQYRIYRDGEHIGTVKGTFFSDSDASGKADARYQVSAVNYHGFEGSKSPPVKVKKSCAQE